MRSGSWGLINREGFTNTNLSLQCSRVVQLHKTKDTATVQTKGKETEQMTGNAKKNKRTMRGKHDERTLKGLGTGTWIKWKGGRPGSILSSMLHAPKACRYHMDSKLFWGRTAASYMFLVQCSRAVHLRNTKDTATAQTKGKEIEQRKTKGQWEESKMKGQWEDGAQELE